MEFKGSRAFLYVPAFAAHDKKLLKHPKAILLIGEINSMLNVSGQFYMSNREIAKRLDCTTRYVQALINLLEEEKYIERIIVRDKTTSAVKGRMIIAGETLVKANSWGWRTVDRNPHEPEIVTPTIERSPKYNNLKDQHNRSFKDNSQAEPDDITQIRKDVVDYLNRKLGTQYKPNASKNKTVINARLNEGYKLDDFKRVIDNKYNDWANDAKMAKYLRPETLFGSKFDGYLNEKSGRIPAQKKRVYW